MVKKSTLKRIAELRAELKRLKDEINTEISKGLFAVVKGPGLSECIPEGTVIKITEIDDEESYYIRAEDIDETFCDYFNAEDIEIITSREQMRNFLIADVEKKLDDIFGPVASGSDE